MNETLLKDIEIDFEQLKCLVNSLNKDTNPILCEAIKRNISQLQNKLEELNHHIPVFPKAQVPTEKGEIEMPEETWSLQSEIEKEDFFSALIEDYKEESLPEKEEDINEDFEITEEEITSEFEIKEESVLEDPAIIERIIIKEEEKELPPPLSRNVTSSLREFITLNDKFRFARELFEEDNDSMNLVINEIDAALSLTDALHYLSTMINVDEENEAYIDFIEIVKRRFNV